MKTLSICLIIITASIFSGCKKDTPANNNKPKTYLLSKVTFTYAPGIFQTQTYAYDDRNRVIDLHDGGQDYQYTYDANNNLIKASTYDATNKLLGTDNFSYSGNKITDQEFYGDGSSKSTESFTLDAQQRVINTTLDDNDVLTYDSNGNLASYSMTGSLTQSDSFTYDNKNNPLSMVGAKNVHMMFFLGYPQTFVNNVTSDEAGISDYTYNYNNDGFPVSASLKGSGSSVISVTYNYIIK